MSKDKEKPKESVIDELKTFLLHAIVLIIILLIGAYVFIVLFDKYVAIPEAKKSVTKIIHSQTLKYIKSESDKCGNGETLIMSNTLKCSDMNSKSLIQAAINVLHDKNPHHPDFPNAVRAFNSNTNDEDVGFINLSASGSTIIIKTCIKTPCNKEANRQSSTVSIK